MPCFHFNFREGRRYSVDEEGQEFADLENAYLEAFRAAQEMWSDLLARKRDPRDCAFDIVDDKGVSLMVLPFLEVVEACKGNRVPAATTPQPFIDVAYEQARGRRLCADVADEVLRAHASLKRTRELLARPSRWPAADR